MENREFILSTAIGLTLSLPLWKTLITLYSKNSEYMGSPDDQSDLVRIFQAIKLETSNSNKKEGANGHRTITLDYWEWGKLFLAFDELIKEMPILSLSLSEIINPMRTQVANKLTDVEGG